MSTRADVGSVACHESSITWSSIWAGVLTALVTGLLFNLLGAAIGFSILLPKSEVLWPLSIGTLIWLILTGIVSMYIGGWVAGNYSYARSESLAILYGIIVSGISTLISLAIMVTAVGSILSNSFSVLERVISASSSFASKGSSVVGKGLDEISTLSPGLTNKIKRAIPDLKSALQTINKKALDLFSKDESAPEKIKFQLENLLKAYLDPSEEMSVDEAQNKLVDTLVQESGKSPDEIKQNVEEWKKMYIEAKEKASKISLEASKKVTKVISQIAFVNFLILLSGIIVASVGAVVGMRNKEY